MKRLEVITEINAKPAVVWRILNDPAMFPKWLNNVEKYEHESGTIGETGSKGILYYSDSGRQYTMDDEMVEARQNEYLKLSLTSKPLDMIIENRLEAIGDAKTKLTATAEFTRRSLIMKVLMAVFTPHKKAQKQHEEQAQKFKELVERSQ